MYKKKYYKKTDEDSIYQDIKKSGYDPIKISDPPGRVYSPHKHPTTKLLVFLQGSMTVTVADQKYNCLQGDKLIIEGNITHSAVAGEKGCVFYWSEKL